MIDTNVKTGQFNAGIPLKHGSQLEDAELGQHYRERLQYHISQQIGNALADGRTYVIRQGPFKYERQDTLSADWPQELGVCRASVMIALANPDEANIGEHTAAGPDWPDSDRPAIRLDRIVRADGRVFDRHGRFWLRVK